MMSRGDCMKFIVMKEIPTNYEPDTFYLLKGVIYKDRFDVLRLDDSWNDYGYHTKYTLLYCDSFQHRTELGVVKLGEFQMGENQISPNLPPEFTSLNPNKFFSVGESEEYYKNIVNLENGKGYDILISLNDFTLCRDVYVKAKEERVTILSLLRGIREDDQDSRIQEFFELLRPPLNLNTMRRIFGSTGWVDVDSGLLEMQQLLFIANTPLYYNAIATMGREILKRVAEKLYIDDLHRDKSKNPEPPTDDQYKNKLCSFVDYLCKKKEITKNLKEYIKTTINLVQEYVHKEQGEGFESFMCVHAVTSLVFQLSIIYKKDKYNELAGQ